MDSLTLETFIRAAEDLELSQYKVLAYLKKYTDALHANKLYPAFTDLIDLGNELHYLMDQLTNYDKSFVLNQKSLGIEQNLNFFEEPDQNTNDINLVFKFINWAMPTIEEAIDEGIAIYDFVNANISIDHVGILPLYRNEGYYFIPDNQSEATHVYHFDMSLFSTDASPLRTLKTTMLDVIDNEELKQKSFESIKLDLIKKFPELPNPAVYNIKTDLDFPFIETILPVAKRLLVRKLAAAA